MDVEIIYRKYFHEIFLYIRTISGSETVAEEIAQETFVKAMKDIEKWDGQCGIRAWLFAIARNTYFRYYRRSRIYTEGGLPDSMPDPAPSALECLIDHETADRIKTCADVLPEPYGEVFRLRIYGELPFEKIGNLYGKNAGWARVIYHRARKMIQKEISTT